MGLWIAEAGTSPSEGAALDISPEATGGLRQALQ